MLCFVFIASLLSSKQEQLSIWTRFLLVSWKLRSDAIKTKTKQSRRSVQLSTVQFSYWTSEAEKLSNQRKSRFFEIEIVNLVQNLRQSSLNLSRLLTLHAATFLEKSMKVLELLLNRSSKTFQFVMNQWISLQVSTHSCLM